MLVSIGNLLRVGVTTALHSGVFSITNILLVSLSLRRSKTKSQKYVAVRIQTDYSGFAGTVCNILESNVLH